MRTSLLVTALSASSVLAAPALPNINLDVAQPSDIATISEYFNLLATRVQQSRLLKAAPTCDISTLSLPPAASELPPPSPGLTLKHVAIGRGTQNYTCDLTNSTAVPKANGALATLFNASCLLASQPDLANMLSAVSLRFDLKPNLDVASESHQLFPSNLVVSGSHWFTDGTTPFFRLSGNLGEAPCAKNASAPAPADAPRGQKGEAAVAWLKLTTKEGATGGLQEVYRIQTAGGSPPATCEGMPASFEVQYATQYWFYSS